jgi:hypothetical protein
MPESPIVFHLMEWAATPVSPSDGIRIMPTEAPLNLIFLPAVPVWAQDPLSLREPRAPMSLGYWVHPGWSCSPLLWG